MKYKDIGAPKYMYDEYMYDYKLHSDARKEYIGAAEEFKDYMKVS